MNEEKELTENTSLPPRKKGLMRLFELLDRDSGKFFKAGILAILSLIPFFLTIAFALATGAPGLLLACIPTGLLAAPSWQERRIPLCGV